MKKRKIVLTDTAVLYSPLWGGPKRIWNIFSRLSEDLFDIDYVGMDLSKIGRGYEVKKIAPHMREFLTYLPFHSKIWKSAEEFFLKELRLPLFSYLAPHTSREFKAVFENLKSDIIVSSHPWAAKCVKKADNKLFIYDAHNCEYHLMCQITGDSLVEKSICKWVKDIEREACKKSDMIFACSKFDVKYFKEIYGIPDRKLKIIPNGTVVNALPEKKEKFKAKQKLNFNHKPTIIFLGSYYKPNIKAAEFIVNHLSKQLEQCRFVIAGSVRNYFHKYNIPENVELFPRVEGILSNEDLELLLKASDIGINPRIAGSGSSIKLLEYLGFGLPSVTTEIGNRGLGLQHLKNVCITSLDNFSNTILKILENQELFTTLRNKSYHYVKKNHNWNSISKRLEKILLDNI